MPELPEVETVRRILEPQLAGRRVETVEIRNPQIIAYPDAEQFAELLHDQTISAMSRRGKFLTIHFSGGDRLCLHLRMTGQLLVVTADVPVEKHTHLLLSLSDGSQLRYIDVRRFGRFWYFRRGEADNITGRSKLGPEPSDPAVTAAYLQEKLGGRKKAGRKLSRKHCSIRQWSRASATSMPMRYYSPRGSIPEQSAPRSLITTGNGWPKRSRKSFPGA